MEEQKYHRGDLVQIKRTLPRSMSHFTSNCRAIVVGSYFDQYRGPSGKDDYTLFIEDRGETSWYPGATFSLVEKGQETLLEIWKQNIAETEEQKSDLNWIFRHGEDVIEYKYHESMIALGKCMGIKDMWPDGEGYTFFQNTLVVMNAAYQFLAARDKDGWLSWCGDK